MGLTQVSTDGVKNDAITKTKIPANQIEASELADNAVDTNAIANNAVTAGKLASGVQTTINNNADNRVITGSGTANTLEGESQFTYDGTTVKNLISVSGSVPTILEVRNTASTWGGGFKFSSNNTYGAFYITNNAGGSSVGLYNSTGGWHWGSNMQFHGGVSPWTDNTHDLGSSSKRWRNLYTTDLQLSNKGKTNDVDGTWGDWTLQEGESKIFMINNRTGKKYSLKMEEE